MIVKRLDNELIIRTYRRKRIYLLFVLFSFTCQLNGQFIQDPDNAVQLSDSFDQQQGKLTFHSDNRDFCNYYLYIFFTYSEGFEGMSSMAWFTVRPGRQQIKTHKIQESAARYSYKYQYAMYRGDIGKKPNIDFVYSLPTADKGTVKAWIIENRDGYQLAFDLPSDTIYACREGMMCDDKLKDHTSKGHKQFNSDRNLSQITAYHSDGSFGEYVFRGKPLVYPGQRIKMGSPIAVIEKTDRYVLWFSVYFLDKNKLQDKTIGNKHTHFRPFFQTVGKGKVRLENDQTYLCECTDEMLMQEMSKLEKKNFLKNK